MRAGDRVALALPARAPFVEALHGCMRLGAVAVPIDLRLSEAERAARAEGCAAIVDAPLNGTAGRTRGCAQSRTPARAGCAPRARPRRARDRRAHLRHDRRRARPVELTYGNWLWSALGSAVALGLDPDERWLCTLPLSHVGGLSILLRSAIYATTAVLHDGFDAAAVAGELQRDGGATLVSVVPTTLARLLDAGLRDPPQLRAALVGGGPIPPALLERARRRGRADRHDLRPHRGLLAGDDRRPAAVLHARADRRRRRDPRRRPDRRARRGRSPTAGCTPATSARSTRRAT